MRSWCVLRSWCDVASHSYRSCRDHDQLIGHDVIIPVTTSMEKRRIVKVHFHHKGRNEGTMVASRSIQYNQPFHHDHAVKPAWMAFWIVMGTCCIHASSHNIACCAKPTRYCLSRGNNQVLSLSLLYDHGSSLLAFGSIFGVNSSSQGRCCRRRGGCMCLDSPIG